MYIGLHVKYRSFLSDCKEILIFSTDFLKIFKYQIFTKIRPVRASLFHAGGQRDEQTNITKLSAILQKRA